MRGRENPYEHPISNTQFPTDEVKNLTWTLDIPCSILDIHINNSPHPNPFQTCLLFNLWLSNLDYSRDVNNPPLRGRDLVAKQRETW